MSAQPQIAALPPSERFAAIMDALCRAMANEANTSRIAGPLVVLIWTRLRRLTDRLTVILLRPQPATRPDRRTRRTRERDRSKNLPRGFAWLRQLLPGIASNAAQLDHLLSDPEMTALLVATPAAGRVIRPLCHTLGLRTPDFLTLPPRQRKPRQPRESRDTNPDTRNPTTTTASRRKNLPSCLEPRPDIPGLPRLPGAAFFTGLKFRT